jgi:hypothetical protein
MRNQLFNLDVPQRFVPSKPGRGYTILSGIKKFMNESEVLLKNNRIFVVLLDRAISHSLLRHGSGKVTHQDCEKVKGDNQNILESGKIAADVWYDEYRLFKDACKFDVSWTRMSRALFNVIYQNRIVNRVTVDTTVDIIPDEEDDSTNRVLSEVWREKTLTPKEWENSYTFAAQKFEVDRAELKQLHEWYLQRVVPQFGPAECEESWRDGIVIDEMERYRELYPMIFKYAKRIVMKPIFKCLRDVYEDTEVLTHVLSEKAWVAILKTSHREDPIESMKLAQNNMKSQMHHVAVEYENGHKRQESRSVICPACDGTGFGRRRPTVTIRYNEAGQEISREDDEGVVFCMNCGNGKSRGKGEVTSHEVTELPMLDNPDIDPSKSMNLEVNDERLQESALFVSLEAVLSPLEMELVNTVMYRVDNPEFEEFAKTWKDRSLAAQKFFGVTGDDLLHALRSVLPTSKARIFTGHNIEEYGVRPEVTNPRIPDNFFTNLVSFLPRYITR